MNFDPTITFTAFSDELRSLINKHSRERFSNTPDFILGQYMEACLNAFETAVQQRETWYGRDARPSTDPRAVRAMPQEERDKIMKDAADLIASDYEPGGKLEACWPEDDAEGYSRP